MNNYVLYLIATVVWNVYLPHSVVDPATLALIALQLGMSTYYRYKEFCAETTLVLEYDHTIMTKCFAVCILAMRLCRELATWIALKNLAHETLFGMQFEQKWYVVSVGIVLGIYTLEKILYRQFFRYAARSNHVHTHGMFGI